MEKSFEKILEVQQKIQKLFPECVLVGGSAVAMKRKTSRLFRCG